MAQIKMKSNEMLYNGVETFFGTSGQDSIEGIISTEALIIRNRIFQEVLQD